MKNLFETIRIYILNYFKKRYIRKELERKFNIYCNETNKSRYHYFLQAFPDRIVTNWVWVISRNKGYRNKNKNYLNLLTESLFKASKIVKTNVLDAEKKKIERQNELLNVFSFFSLYDDIKSVIEKHYKDRETKLKQENLKLELKLKEKDRKINKIKEDIKDNINNIVMGK